jgi:hypothetical protein
MPRSESVERSRYMQPSDASLSRACENSITMSL